VISSETLIAGRVLFIGAHCDDIEIGCGGTAAKCTARGDTIAFAIATRGNNDAIRKTEAVKAAALLGLSERKKDLFFGSFLDGELNRKDTELRAWLKEVSKQFKPDTVFVHRNDDHTDHQAIYKIAIGVFQDKNVFLYYIPRPFTEAAHIPNYAEDISDVIRKKVAMCKCHASQPSDYISTDSVKTSGHYWYLRCYTRFLQRKDGYAEPFTIHAIRAALSGKTLPSSGSKAPALKYQLRLIRNADGTYEWGD